MNANDQQKAIHYLITIGVRAPSDLGDGDLIIVRYTMPQNVRDIQTHSSYLRYTSSTQ